MTENEILTYTIRIFGERLQEDLAIEEFAELTQALIHKRRGRENNIAEEIADCEIMLEQLKIINGCHLEVKAIRKQKIERLVHRLQEICGRMI